MLDLRLPGSVIPKIYVKRIVDWVLEWFSPRDWPHTIYIAETQLELRGRASWETNTVKVWVGRDHHFPTEQKYPNRSDRFPTYMINDPTECLVNVLAHEMSHFIRVDPLKIYSDKRQRSELKAERLGEAILKAFRDDRGPILDGCWHFLVDYPWKIVEKAAAKESNWTRMKSKP